MAQEMVSDQKSRSSMETNSIDQRDQFSVPSLPRSRRLSTEIEGSQPAESFITLDTALHEVTQAETSGLVLALERTGLLGEKMSGNSYLINLGVMQRIQLRRLQCKLSRHAMSLQIGIKPEGDDWEEDLPKYVRALQDYEYMEKCRKRRRDPFIITGVRALDRVVLSQAAGFLPDNASELGDPVKTAYWESEFLPIVGSRTWTRIGAFVGRVAVAAVGAAFLIGPMWLMMLKNDLYTGLISTTVFIVSFGFLMACVLDEYVNVLSSTAAYAAVLVVFVALAVLPGSS